MKQSSKLCFRNFSSIVITYLYYKHFKNILLKEVQVLHTSRYTSTQVKTIIFKISFNPLTESKAGVKKSKNMSTSEGFA